MLVIREALAGIIVCEGPQDTLLDVVVEHEVFEGSSRDASCLVDLILNLLEGVCRDNELIRGFLFQHFENFLPFESTLLDVPDNGWQEQAHHLFFADFAVLANDFALFAS